MLLKICVVKFETILLAKLIQHVCILTDLLNFVRFLCVHVFVQDKRLFRKTHEKMGSPDNKTTLRLLFYPIIEKLKEGQLRLGEHTDYGTITLLFQDQIGGLEVWSPRVVCHGQLLKIKLYKIFEYFFQPQVLSQKEGFIPARPIDGTIVVNIGDLLQRWTNDKLVSTVSI